MSERKDMIGQKFGRLTVLEESDPQPGKKGVHRKWICLCTCGRKRIVRGNHLRSGNTRSCGCMRDEAMQRAKRIENARRGAL